MKHAAPTNASPPPMAARLLRGTAWTVGMRWGIRLLGLLSMIVLARLLAPEDFGLHAMAMTVIALVDVLTDLGVGAALIRDKNAGPAQFDTAWTIRQGQLCFVAVLVAAMAPLAATYYQDPRVAPVLQVIAIAFVVRGFENIGIINFRRELQFHLDFLFEVLVKLLAVVMTIGLAVWLRSYWALALGIVASNLLRVVLSYSMSRYRPTWTLAAWRELWEFSQWVLSQGFARYVYERADILILGRLSSPSQIGYYSVSNEVAQLPAASIALPVSRVVFPGLAQLTDDPRRLRNAYLNSLGAVAAVAIPAAMGILAIAPELIALALGENWLPAVPLLRVFSLLAVFWALTSLSTNLLVVLGYVRYNTLTTWVQAILLMIAIVPAFQMGNLMGVASLRALLSLVGLSLVFYFVVRISETRWIDLAAALLRPVLATIAMLVYLGLSSTFTNVAAADPSSTLIVALAVKVLGGGAVYTSVLLASWYAAGTPEGIESVVMEKLRARKKASAH